MKALENHKRLLDEEAIANHLHQHHIDRIQVKATLQRYDELRDKLGRDIKQRSHEECQRNHKETQKWLAAPSPFTEHERACQQRKYESQSGAWLFDKSELKEWKDIEAPDSSILWMHGIPGAGKLISHIRTGAMR